MYSVERKTTTYHNSYSLGCSAALWVALWEPCGARSHRHRAADSGDLQALSQEMVQDGALSAGRLGWL